MLGEPFRPISIEALALTDYYSVNPPRQPKGEIAEYVESQGIPVPRRFRGLDEALTSGRPFVVRSEHPQEYGGISDLLQSYNISEQRIAEAQKEHGVTPPDPDWVSVKASDSNALIRAKDQVIAQLGNVPQEKFEDNLKHLSDWEIGRYCRLTGVDQDRFFSDASYTY